MNNINTITLIIKLIGAFRTIVNRFFFAIISEAKLIGFMASVINKALKLRTLRKEKKR